MMASIAEDTRAGINDLSRAAGRGLAFGAGIKVLFRWMEMSDRHHFANFRIPLQFKTALRRPAICFKLSGISSKR
jgi:hypothetical protein